MDSIPKKPVILFRKYSWNKEEREIASQYFDVVYSRMKLRNRLVIGRFSTLPLYHELQNDLQILKSSLINGTLDHQYIANFDYYQDIKQYTPKTYFEASHLPDDGGPFFVKGRTNSKKHLGFNKTKASNKAEAIKLQGLLLEDADYDQQGVIFRDYIPLKVIEKNQLNDQQNPKHLDFYNEWRFFFYQDQLLCYGYYWVNAENILTNDQLPPEAIDFAKTIAKIIKERVNFFVIDIGQTESGEWIVIECNDGQQSGLSNCDPHELYSNLAKCLAQPKN